MYENEQIYKYLEYYKEITDAYLATKQILKKQYNLAQTDAKKQKVIEQVGELDNIMLNYFKPTDFFALNWLIDTYTKAIVLDSSICEKVSSYNKAQNKKIIELFNKIIRDQDIDIDNLQNAFDVIQSDNKKEYRLKNLPIFMESTQPVKCTNGYHGTTIGVAQIILKMGKLLPYNRVVFHKKRGVDFNANKIFFTPNFEKALYYATRWRWKKPERSIIFKFNLSDYDVYVRKHLLLWERNDDLLFVNAIELPIDNILEKIYVVDYLTRKREISRKELLEMKDED